MAMINRFEVGGIFYDCEDSDAQDKITEIQRQRALRYADFQWEQEKVVSNGSPQNYGPFAKRGMAILRASPASGDPGTGQRNLRIKVNGSQITILGGPNQNPGIWLLGNYPLKPGDIITLEAFDASSLPATVHCTFIPFEE